MRVTSRSTSPGRAEPGKDLHAESVRGLDRGGVEVGDGLGKPFVPERHLLGRTVGQQLGDVVVWVGLEATEGGRQRFGGTEEPVADPFAQLARGHAGERHDEQPVERQTGRDVAGGKGGDGERLAGSGAGFEQGDAAWEATADVEGLRRRPRRRRHESTSCSCSSRPSQSRRA